MMHLLCISVPQMSMPIFSEGTFFWKRGSVVREDAKNAKDKAGQYCHGPQGRPKRSCRLAAAGLRWLQSARLVPAQACAGHVNACPDAITAGSEPNALCANAGGHAALAEVQAKRASAEAAVKAERHLDFFRTNLDNYVPAICACIRSRWNDCDFSFDVAALQCHVAQVALSG